MSGSVSATFAYDGVGRRRAKTIGGATTGFLYDGLNGVQELSRGSPSATIVSGLDLDEWFTRTDGAGTKHFLTDVLGSTLGLTDGSGVVQTEYTYEPFGSTTASGVASANTTQFTGRENDGTGLAQRIDEAEVQAAAMHRRDVFIYRGITEDEGPTVVSFRDSLRQAMEKPAGQPLGSRVRLVGTGNTYW